MQRPTWNCFRRFVTFRLFRSMSLEEQQYMLGKLIQRHNIAQARKFLRRMHDATL